MAIFDKEYPQANFSVAAFLETYHKDEDDFPDLINEYMVTHHCSHTPTPLDHTQSGIIVLVNKQYDILQSVIKIPGRLLNLHLRHNATKHTYNLTVYYAGQFKELRKPEMISVVQAFSQVHDVSHNNIIIGGFNFADNDMEKGKGMDYRDHMMTSIWEGFASAMASR